MRYLPHTPEEVEKMLEVIGKSSLEQLFESLPEGVRCQGILKLPEPLAESQLMRHLAELSAKNTQPTMLSFLGAGMYAHHIPPAVDQLLLRSEFYTAYTPYQPEVSQGTLQAIWEFQTVVSELYGLPLANASLYDGASAAAEAVQMARRLTRRNRVITSGCVHPQYREVIRTYLGGSTEAEVSELPVSHEGGTNTEALMLALDEEVACVVVGYPSFFGTLRDLRELATAAHAKGALLIATNSEPYALALAEPPGTMGADIVAGEGQPIACPPQYGGPGVGLFACRDERRYLQQLPGRVCGRTVDKHGRPGFVLTLSTREQHIRRERATSNICTNQGLLALALVIRMSLLGRRGFIETATHCTAKARYLRSRVLALPGYTPTFRGEPPFFNEFAVRVRGGKAERVCRALEEDGIVAGLDLGTLAPELSDSLLIAVTERHERSDLDRFVEALDRLA